jgi:hypothetical protein
MTVDGPAPASLDSSSAEGPATYELTVIGPMPLQPGHATSAAGEHLGLEAESPEP